MKASFRGESVHKLDSKGRLSIPAPFRRELEKGDPDFEATKIHRFILVYGHADPSYLECYSIESMARLERKIRKLPQFSDARKNATYTFLTQSMQVELDPTGRIVLPQKLRERIGEHEGHSAPHGLGVLHGVQPVDEDLPRGGVTESVEQPQQRRLARSVRSDDGDPPLFEGQRDVPEEYAVGLATPDRRHDDADVAHFDHRANSRGKALCTAKASSAAITYLIASGSQNARSVIIA